MEFQRGVVRQVVPPRLAVKRPRHAQEIRFHRGYGVQDAFGGLVQHWELNALGFGERGRARQQRAAADCSGSAEVYAAAPKRQEALGRRLDRLDNSFGFYLHLIFERPLNLAILRFSDGEKPAQFFDQPASLRSPRGAIRLADAPSQRPEQRGDKAKRERGEGERPSGIQSRRFPESVGIYHRRFRKRGEVRRWSGIDVDGAQFFGQPASLRSPRRAKRLADSRAELSVKRAAPQRPQQRDDEAKREHRESERHPEIQNHRFLEVGRLRRDGADERLIRENRLRDRLNAGGNDVLHDCRPIALGYQRG